MYGEGYPLFFRFFKNCLITLIITFFISNIYSLALYVTAENCLTYNYSKSIMSDIKNTMIFTRYTSNIRNLNEGSTKLALFTKHYPDF